MSNCALRIGNGYDVHRLVDGRPFILGGVQIPFDKGLMGHSDADVLSHAITDALLGALALGNIGTFFPDTDPAYKDADSLVLLDTVVDVVHKQGYSIVNVDTVVACQRPKLNPFVADMRSQLATRLRVNETCVSVKPTTTETLGFEGRGEGVSAHAVVLLSYGSNR